MQDLKIAIVQANQIWEDKTANWNNYLALLSGIDEPMDLIVLPEMFDTGFSMNVKLAEEWENSSALAYLKDLSKMYNSAIYTSVICGANGRFYNRGVFVSPDDSVVYYDKRKTFSLAGEDRTYTAGDEEKIVSYKGWKIQLQICYDLRFPELCRNRLTKDTLPAYDLLLYVANWPERRALHWKTLLQARAIENQCYVVGVNRVGKDGNDLLYSGDSVCISALGETEWCKSHEEMVKVVSLSKTALEQTRLSLPFLRDR